jgi:YesN/AraC family two-component response regulator
MAANILIVDDEEGIRKSLGAYLKMEGYAVDTAADGAEAIEKLKNAKFNIILLDINMPVMDGLEAIQQIKALDFSIQVIMMTAFSTFDKTMKSLEYGATDYILKPFDNLAEILNLIRISEERLDRWKKNMSATIIKQRSSSGQ